MRSALPLATEETQERPLLISNGIIHFLYFYMKKQLLLLVMFQTEFRLISYEIDE